MLLQVSKEKIGVIEVLKNIYHSRGFMGFYKGILLFSYRSKKFIVFYGGSGKSANCNKILPEVACIYPKAC